MRKQITLFDDQYAFYKQFKSKKLLVSFVEYMFEDIEPTWLNSIEQTLRNSLVERMDGWKIKSDAWSLWWSKSRGWWRPKKQAEQQTENKQKTNKKTNKKQAKNNQDKDKEEDKDIEQDKENKILSSYEDNSEADYWKKEINSVIEWIKAECNKLWVAYEKTMEREFAKHIATAKEFGNFCEKIWQDRLQFAINVLRASIQIKFWKWVCAWPKAIYQNYAEVYNETMKQKAKAKTIPKF